MKKILSFSLVLIFLFSACVSVCAVESGAELEQKFYDYCVSVLPEDKQPTNSNGVRIYASVETEGAELFFGFCKWLDSGSDDVYKAIGNWRVYSSDTYYPYDLGVYVSSGDEVYTLEEAYQKGVITDLTSVKYLSSSHACIEAREDYKYIDKLLPELLSNAIGLDVAYREAYEYFSPENIASGDEATPDYVLINFTTNAEDPMEIADVFGDYVLWDYGINHPFAYGYCIYLPESGEVYDLVDAWEMGMDGIENVFTEGGIGELIGDMDKDRKLTVKDATFIQKCLAGLESFDYNDKFEYFGSMLNSNWEEPNLLYISDFNRDYKRNIKDATAIQKHIAGLEY